MAKNSITIEVFLDKDEGIELIEDLIQQNLEMKNHLEFCHKRLIEKYEENPLLDYHLEIKGLISGYKTYTTDSIRE